MNRREFQFVEGSSRKFWAIELNGSSFTLNWGRIGTSGQTQTKEFASDAEAGKQYEKLVAEKVKKGYSEVGGGGNGAAATKTAAAKPAGTKAAASTKPPAKAPVARDAGKERAATATGATAGVTPAPTAPSAPVNFEVTRSIDLEPADWSTATWRPYEPPARQAAQPFDRDACAARVAKVSVGTYGWKWDWATAGIPQVMTREEAHFWLAAMTQAHSKIKPKELAAKLAKQEFEPVDREEALALLKKKKTVLTGEVLLPLSNLVSACELVEMLSDQAPRRSQTYAEAPWNDDPEIVFAFRQYVLPYLTGAERQMIRQSITPQVDPKNWPADHYTRPPAAFFVAAMTGMSDKLLPVVQGWTPGFYLEPGWDHGHYHQPQVVVLGLGSARLVEAEMRRHKLPLNKPEYIRGWLATTEYAALDHARDSILAVTNREEAERLMEAFARVKAPEAAPHMLELKLSSKAPRVAREWLEQNVGSAIAGLIPAAAGRGKLADAAVEHLRDLKRAGHGDLIRKAAGKDASDRLRHDVIEHVEKTYAPFDDSNTPEWLSTAPGDAPKAKLPPWLPPHALPILAVGANRLNDEQVLAVIGALQKGSLDAPHPFVKAVRENASPESRDAFAWRLFESWTAEGAPSKDKWAMRAIGHLGADGCVLKLTPMIRNWPGESQHQRAVFGLECLRGVGSDIALMQLNGIAQKLKFKGLKNKAMEFMEAIASQRNMTRSELEDRIVPDCDLDGKGTRTFDFGPRQFRFVLGPDMKAMIKDAEGKVKSDLPSPGAKDDNAKAAEAVEAWKLLKRQIREIGKVQAERLEQAMVTGRRWKAGDFELLLVKHPLMINFVRLLVWGGYDANGSLRKTFRVTEDQTYADEDDTGTDLDGVSQVGVVHAIELSDEQKRAWGEVLSDYEIVPPFDQVGRPIYALEQGEEKAKDFTRFANVKIPATALVGTLERLAWTRGIPQDAGIFYEHTKPFYGANVTAVVNYEDGVPVGYMEGWEDQRITSCFFVPGIYKPQMYPEHKNAMKLGEVDRIAVSEVLKDLALIASKGK
jgi:predicted DNA-binding WGR domain protein